MREHYQWRQRQEDREEEDRHHDGRGCIRVGKVRAFDSGKGQGVEWALSQILDEDERNYHLLLSMQPRHKTVPLAFGAHYSFLSAALYVWRA